MKTLLLICLTILSFSFSGCTVVVSDPHPTYTIREVDYQGTRPVEVYYYGGYYYYAPSPYIAARYYHTRVGYYSSRNMHVIKYQRPSHLITVKEPPRKTVIIKEDRPKNNTNVIIRKEPTRTTVIKEDSPRSNTTIIRKEEPQRNNTVIIKQDSHTNQRATQTPQRNQVIIKQDSRANNSTQRTTQTPQRNQVIIKQDNNHSNTTRQPSSDGKKVIIKQ